MSFDAKVYFSAVPTDFAAKWQAALRDLGMTEVALVPRDWEQSGCWYLLDQPTDKPEDSFAIEVRRVDAAELEEESEADDEKAMLATARYVAFVSTRLSAGSAALMAAGSIAKATGGVVVEPQGAAFETAFEADLAAHRGPQGPEGKPTLVERGYYDARLAWEIAKAASAHEQRQRGKPAQSASAPAKAQDKMVPILVLVGVLLWALYKLHKAGYF